MTFRWAEEGRRCSATMISDQVALTATHCVLPQEDGLNPYPSFTVKMADEEIYGVKEVRVHECWDKDTRPYYIDDYHHDIALMIFDRPIPNAIEGIQTD